MINIDELDELQYSIYSENIETNIIVKGGQGSGANILALHRAKILAQQDKSYALIVSTKLLHKFIEDSFLLESDNVYYKHRWFGKNISQPIDYLIICEAEKFENSEINDLIKLFNNSISFYGNISLSIEKNIINEINKIGGNLKTFKLERTY